MPDFVIKKYGESAILFEWTSLISESINQQVLEYDSFLHDRFTDLILETTTAYHSLVVFLKKNCSPESFIERLNNEPYEPNISTSNTHYSWEIPVCYDLEYAIDLDEVAQSCSLNTDEVIKIHTSQDYRIYFTGFIPGFLYLGGLDQRLHTPRKKQPRLRIPKGSVAIGGQQTGIYPQVSPGGWQIIGRTPISLFDPEQEPPARFKSGDFVRFRFINRQKFDQIIRLEAAGEYQLNRTVHD